MLKKFSKSVKNPDPFYFRGGYIKIKWILSTGSYIILPRTIIETIWYNLINTIIDTIWKINKQSSLNSLFKGKQQYILKRVKICFFRIICSRKSTSPAQYTERLILWGIRTSYRVPSTGIHSVEPRTHGIHSVEPRTYGI